VKRLIDVQKNANASLEEMQDFVNEHLHKSWYSTREISILLGITENELINGYLGQVRMILGIKQKHRKYFLLNCRFHRTPNFYYMIEQCMYFLKQIEFPNLQQLPLQKQAKISK